MTDMERRTKIIILVVGGVLIIGTISLGLHFHFKNKREEEEAKNDSKKFEEPKAGESKEDTKTTPETTPETTVINDGKTRPTFNVENELSNPIGKLKGHYLYPKRKAQGGWGYSNVRTSALVNNDQGWWDPSDNLITTINSGTSIGKVLSEASGVYNGYSYRWFKVKLTKPTGGVFSPYTVGYVRGDTVTFATY